MSQFFIYKNTKIHFAINGKGSVVVLLHGFLENLKMWNEIASELSKTNKVIRIDLLGHGHSESMGYIHTMEQQAEMVKAVLNSFKLRKFQLIGHSMGGYVALAFSKIYPNTIKGLCLMNSTAYSDSKEKRINRNRAIKVVKQNHKTFVQVSIPQLFAVENRTFFKKEIDHVTSESLKTSKQGIIGALEGMKIRNDYTAILRNDSIKKLLILGKKDTVLDFKIHKRQIENTSTELVEMSQGHMSYIENKEELIEILKKFINL